MILDTNKMIALTEANQNFSKVVKIVEEEGRAVILKNNKPKFIVLDFEQYDEIITARDKMIENATNDLILENIEALRELAK